MIKIQERRKQTMKTMKITEDQEMTLKTLLELNTMAQRLAILRHITDECGTRELFDKTIEDIDSTMEKLCCEVAMCLAFGYAKQNEKKGKK